MIKPKRASIGDMVGIFLPSSSINQEYRENGLEEIKSLGFQPVEADNMLSNKNYLAKQVYEVVDDFISFLNDKDIKIIWAARGGYGANYLVEALETIDIYDFTPKIIMGSSDVSYLLWHILDNYKTIVFYSPMVYSSVAEKNYNKDQLLDVITGNYKDMYINGDIFAEGKASGVVTGGCLSNFVSLIGTKYFPKIDNKILFLEDVSEPGYKLDRMFWQIDKAGIFKRIRALILGKFHNCFKDNNDKNLFFKNLKNRIIKYGFPVIRDLPFGHGENLHILPLGIEIEIDTNRFQGIKFCEKGVK